jgi:hypothetical protein
VPVLEPLRSRRPTAEPDARGAACQRWQLPSALLLLVLTWALTLPGTYHSMFPDGVSYAAVAGHLLDGRWDAAINAYWSPLWSWLYLPTLALGGDEFLAARVAGLLAAALVLFALDRWLQRSAPATPQAAVALLALVPLLVWAATTPSPDLLLAGLLLLFLETASRPDAVDRPRVAVTAGALAGVAYLAKLFALPFVLAAVPLVVVHHRLARRPLASVLRSAGTMLVVFLAVVTAWSAVLSVDAGQLTVGTAASVNLDVGASDSKGSPIYYGGLFPPAHPDAANVWEDPGALPRSVRGPAVDSGSVGTAGNGPVLLRVKLALENVPQAAREMGRWKYLIPLLLLLHVPLLGRWRERPLPEAVRDPLLLLLGSSVFVGGTLLVYVDERYLRFALLALLPGAVAGVRPAAALLARARPDGGASGAGYARVGLTGLLVAALLWPGVRALHGAVVEPQPAAQLATSLGDRDLRGARVASDRRWEETMSLCLHLGCRYYGLVSPARHDDWREQLQRHDVDYYLVWDDDNRDLAESAPRWPAVGHYGDALELRLVEVDRLPPPGR